MSLPTSFLDEVRARTSLSTLVGKTVKLVKKGNEWAAPCPFHNEKTPSFYVNDAKGFYHCFGCSAHGDAIGWMVDQRGLPFMDAVRELATAAGLDMPAQDRAAREQSDRRKPLLDAMDQAAKLFAQNRDARAPAGYLERRGVDRQLAQTFEIGFAPDTGSFIPSNLRNFSSATLIEAGLVIQPDDDRAPFDRFRGRLMFPIHDARGRVIAFGGRILGQGEPKYLNSPDTPLFDKGRSLFNYHRAAPATRQTKRLIVVEGYMDVIGLARVGILDVVAPNGTAVTETQLALMWKLAEQPIMMLDGDAAGGRAMVKAALRALPGLTPGNSLRFAPLPTGADPDDLARTGGQDAVEKALAASIGLAELLWRHEVAHSRLDEPEGRAGLKQRLIDHTSTIEHGGVRDEYRAEFRRRFDEAFAAAPPPQRSRAAPGQRRGKWTPPERPVSAGTRALAQGGVANSGRLAILAGLLHYPDVVGRMVERLVSLKYEGRYQQLLNVLVDASLDGRTVDGETLPGLLADAGMAGAPGALATAVRLPFSFLTPGGGDAAREALVDAIYAETM